MSQVVVTEDKFKEKRKRSGQQESKIDKTTAFKQWHMSDPTRPDIIPKIVGALLAPVLAIWSVVMAFMAFALAVTLGAFRVLGKLWPRS